MKATEVTIKLSIEQEFDLMSKYGRRCSREGLVMRAIADAVQNGAEPKTPKTRKPRKKKDDTPSLLPENQVVPLACSSCKWKGSDVPGSACPDCGAALGEPAQEGGTSNA